MKASALLRRAFAVLFIPALLSTLLLYNYPFVKGCAFPKPSSSPSPAPFRLLAFGDPQLEGSTSLPNPNDPLLPSLRAYLGHVDYSQGFPTERPTLFWTLQALYYYDIPRLIYIYRKRLDLFGNDYYLAHIYRSLHSSLAPTHVTVLGDLVGSQWIDDGEFSWRAWRFWKRVFAGARKVEDKYTTLHGPEPLTMDWNRRIINVAGNHDIGYSGDITRERADRFEALFGRLNWDVRFSIASNASGRRNPELRVVVLNGMNMDGPAYDRDIQTDTYAFLNNHLIGHARPAEERSTATVLLTHIPMDKEDGVCVDGTMFEYGPSGLREQNQLSRKATLPILEGVFGLKAGGGKGRNGVILTGHDHEGCDSYHYLRKDAKDPETQFGTVSWRNAGSLRSDRTVPGVREITVRSMMGSFGGNAGLLSAWFDETWGEWRFEYDTCAVGVQHIWWAVHVLDIITVSLLLLSQFFAAVEGLVGSKKPKPRKRKTLRAGEENGPLVRTLYRNGDASSSGRQTKSPGTKRRKV